MKEPLDIAVLGAGTAGSAAALFLSRAGHKVTVYECVKNPGPVGAGITLQPTGLAALEALGLADQVLSRGARIDRLVCKSDTGRVLTDLSYARYDTSYFGTGTHRGVLFQTLYGAVHGDGIPVHTGIVAENVKRSGERGWLYVEEDTGTLHGPHQLIVVCDGARSHLRDDTWIPKNIAPYPWGALWFVGKVPDEHCGTTLHQVVRGNSCMVGVLPTGLGPNAENTGQLASLFWSIRKDSVDAWRLRFDPWKEECRRLMPLANVVLDQIHEPEQVLFAAYHDVSMYPWNTANVVYLGDAAHATSPQLGQGANLALVDALVLAQAIQDNEFLPAALDAYSRRRRAHLSFYQHMTRWLTPFFQGDEVWFGILRDLGLPLGMKIPPLESFMVATMTGTVAGFLGGNLLADLKRGVRPGL